MPIFGQAKTGMDKSEMSTLPLHKQIFLAPLGFGLGLGLGLQLRQYGGLSYWILA
jgi:hypothetical protein